MSKSATSGFVAHLSRELCPPLLRRAAKSALSRAHDILMPPAPATPTSLLFDGDSALFVDLAAKAHIYGEYGVGASTIWVAENTEAHIVSVDSSSEWLSYVKACVPHNRLTAIWADLGALGDWGRPLSYSGRARFATYRQAIWKEMSPDLVLVDGRFRVACVLETLLHAAPGTRILVDDYSERPWYHVIEEFVTPIERHGRQVAFEVPKTLDHEALLTELVHFEYVMD